MIMHILQRKVSILFSNRKYNNTKSHFLTYPSKSM